jgi:hypothetical protein
MSQAGNDVTSAAMSSIIWVVAIVLMCLAFRAARKGKRSGTMTGAVAGTMYDWQNQEKQKAIEIIVEGTAGARDPEDKDGNLPDLEKPSKEEPRCMTGRRAI